MNEIEKETGWQKLIETGLNPGEKIFRKRSFLR